MTAAVRLDSREDLLAITPFNLGFHPVDSIVLLGLARRRLTLTGRADADLAPSKTIARFAVALRRARLRRAVLFAYGPESIAENAVTVGEGLRSRGFEIVDELRVTGERYHCLRCTECTPPDGVPFDVSASPVTAGATLAGMVALSGREAVVKLVAPIGGLAALAIEQAVDRAEQRLGSIRDNAELVAVGRRVVDDVMRLARAEERLDDDQLAWLSVLIADTDVRDHAWAHTDDEQWQLELWLDLTRRVQPILGAPFASLLGWCAWRQGNGVLAHAALERALRIDPTYEMAIVLQEALFAACPPTTIRRWPPRPD